MGEGKSQKTITKPTLLYEDDDVLVVDKPAGVLVHADGRESDGLTLVDWFLARCPEARGVGEETRSQDGAVLERSGIVHRLDRDTSGVVILAKRATAYDHLKAQFHDRLAKKEYQAFVYGEIKHKQMVIDRPIGRSARDFRLRSAERGARGRLRDAVTEVTLLDSGVVEGEKFSYLSLRPITGRTHQLRVHLKAIDRPIVGDQLYAGKRLEQSYNLAFTRLALHAHQLTIILQNGEQKTFTAPLPTAFEVAAKRIAK